MLFAQDTTYIVTTNDNSGWWAAMAAWWFVWVIFAVVMIVAHWVLFEKAREPGWKSIVPFYNAYTLFRIAGRNGWWFLALFVPVVNVVVLIMMSLDLAKHFRKSAWFGFFGLFVFSVIGYLILAFGDAKYVGRKHA